MKSSQLGRTILSDVDYADFSNESGTKFVLQILTVVSRRVLTLSQTLYTGCISHGTKSLFVQ